jgi:hypothetical protein
MSSKLRRGGIAGQKRKNKISGQFVYYTREMIESPAYRVLSLQGRKVMRRLELEHMAHGGQDNGKLPCRYHDFINYGCRRHGLSAALIEVEALGFVETMSRGTRAYGNVPGKASTFRLTYLHTQDGPSTNEWKKLSSIEEARAAVAIAQRTHSDWLDAAQGSPRHRQRRGGRKNKTPAPETGPNPAPEVGAKSA